MKVDLVEAPEVRSEVDAAATHQARVYQRRVVHRASGFGGRVVAIGLWIVDRIVGKAVREPVTQLIMLEVGRSQAGALFQNHDIEAGLGELARKYPTGGA